MEIQIAMIIFIALLLLVAWYMWIRKSGHFLIYDVGARPELAKILSYTSISLIIVSALGIFILFLGNKYLNLITISLACLVILIFGILFNQKN